MRKMFILWTVLLGSIVNTVYSQSVYKINYSVETQSKESLENKSETVKALINKITAYTNKKKFNLLFNQDESFFEEEQMLVRGNSSYLEEILEKGAKGLTGFNSKTYISYENNLLIYGVNTLGKDYFVKRKPYNFNWKLKSASKKILGYEAKMASGWYFNNEGIKINVEAWYIPQISMQSGPDIFMGLPGLIVEVNKEKMVIKAQKIKKTESMVIKKLPVEKAINQHKFDSITNKAIDKFKNNF